MSSFSFSSLLALWDQQQGAYIAEREARFNAQLDVLELSVGQDFQVLDLACGQVRLACVFFSAFLEPG